MKRWQTGLWALLGVAAAGCTASVAQPGTFQGIRIDGKSPIRPDKVVRTDEEWRKRLDPEAYRILRSKGTEPAFCSPWHDQKRPGTYVCKGCDLEIFRGGEKFVSGTGWPSFFRPATPDAVWTKMDYSIVGMPRVEVLCGRCDGHLGHVFPDGPEPTGLRYCINAQAMNFVPSPAKVADPGKPKG